jgi:Predicted membrane protein (DUF2207) N-terminal domain
MRRLLRCGLAVVIAAGSAGLFPACRRQPPPAPAIDRYGVRLTLLQDGSVQVRETIGLTVGPGVAQFVRDVPKERVDTFFAVTAQFDGQTPAIGSGQGQVSVSHAGPLHVVWRFPSGTAGAHTLTLAYRAAGVISVQGGQGTFRWNTLPSGHGPIRAAHVELDVPPGAVITGTPAIEAYGWRMAYIDSGVVADKSAIPAGETAVIRSNLAVTSLALAEPDWQYEQKRAQDLTPTFIAAGLFLPVVGAGILIMIWVQYPTRRIRAELTPAEPGSLAPAMALAVARGRPGRVRGELRAALFGLAQRGVVSLSPGQATGEPAGVTADLSGEAAALDHERVVLDELWLDRAGQSLPVNTILSRLHHTRKTFRRALLKDLEQAGLVDPDRVVAARGLRASGVLVVALGLAGAITVPFVLTTFGSWPIFVPICTVLMGAMFWVGGGRLLLLNDDGQLARASWQLRLRQLRAVASGREAGGTAADLARWLPVAAGLGMGRAWAQARPPDCADQEPALFEMAKLVG